MQDIGQLLPPKSSSETFDPSLDFGNCNPLEVEVGCGNGRYLLELASRLPQINFLGIEQREKWLQKGEAYKKSLALANVMFVSGEAFQFIHQQLESDSVQAFHIYFPDPWPKRKHRRRRLFLSNFILLLHDRLKIGGRIHLATDFEEYFNRICLEIERTAIPWRDISKSPGNRPFPEQIKTK